jgi:hypothetical protein
LCEGMTGQKDCSDHCCAAKLLQSGSHEASPLCSLDVSTRQSLNPTFNDQNQGVKSVDLPALGAILAMAEVKQKPPHLGGGFRNAGSVLAGKRQAAATATIIFRRYAMKPTPAKPRMIIAHVEASLSTTMLSSCALAEKLKLAVSMVAGFAPVAEEKSEP